MLFNLDASGWGGEASKAQIYKPIPETRSVGRKRKKGFRHLISLFMKEDEKKHFLALVHLGEVNLEAAILFTGETFLTRKFPFLLLVGAYIY